LKQFLNNASKAYYEGSPFLTDAEFDSLAKKYNYNSVGHSITDGIPHLYKMYSLQKFFSEEEFPSDYNKYIKTPKLDGAAISIVYVKGHIAVALTRGDGNVGRDITEKVKTLVPNTISIEKTVQITGEIVCPSSIENARNVASGSLNLKNLEEFLTRPLSFVAYNMEGVDVPSFIETLELLSKLNFNVVTEFDSELFPTDGLVYRINNNSMFEKMGYTSHHPRGAFALKEVKEGVLTTLLDVIWQVGKSGVVSPVAILEPVEVQDAIVKRATLHNIDYIRSLNLEIGCTVEVIRSGEIIPRIVRRVDQEKNSS